MEKGAKKYSSLKEVSLATLYLSNDFDNMSRIKYCLLVLALPGTAAAAWPRAPPPWPRTRTLPRSRTGRRPGSRGRRRGRGRGRGAARRGARPQLPRPTAGAAGRGRGSSCPAPRRRRGGPPGPTGPPPPPPPPPWL